MDKIFSKAGADWTDEESHRAREWVCEPEQLTDLHAIAGAYFHKECGKRMTPKRQTTDGYTSPVQACDE